MNKFYFFILIILCSCSKTSSEKTELNTADKFYDKAEVLYSKNQDSAFFYFNKAFNSYALKKDSNNCARSLIFQSIIRDNAGDYFGAEETNIEALKFLKNSNNKDIFLSLYNEIAISRKNLKDFKTALIWYQKSFKISTDSLEKVKISNNISVVYSKLKNYKKSISILDRLLNNKVIEENPNIKSKIIDNLGFIKFLKNKNYNAESELNNALLIRIKSKDIWGQNASHAHLSDYFKEKDSERALYHANKMYEIAKQLKSPDDEIEALQKLVSLENAEESKKYFKTYLNLSDSLQNARNRAKNQFALIRYETEKNKADFLRVNAENIQKNYQLLFRNIALGVSILLLFLGIFWYVKRKKRLDQEKELEVKNTELKYSKKIHDVVSNGIYQVMSEIENKIEINKPQILDKLEMIYEKSRDISYENVLEDFSPNYKNQILNLVRSFSSDSLKTIIIGNEEELWLQISQKVKAEILIILQELLVNMKKHSEAKQVILKFEVNENKLNIDYFDDGIGFGEIITKRNGLQNTENRIFSCSGNLTFDQSMQKGTKINISFPLKND